MTKVLLHVAYTCTDSLSLIKHLLRAKHFLHLVLAKKAGAVWARFSVTPPTTFRKRTALPLLREGPPRLASELGGSRWRRRDRETPSGLSLLQLRDLGRAP